MSAVAAVIERSQASGARGARLRVALRGLIAIAAREASERAALLGLAVLAALAPFGAPYVGIGDRPFLGVFAAVVMVVAAACLTGSSVIARDLAEGRLGFFLARPLPWWAIWGGKLLAAAVLTLVAGAIVVIPSMLTGDWSLPPTGWWGLMGIPALLALICGVHAAAVGYRSRSGLFAADLALAALVGWTVARTVRSLLAAGVFADVAFVSLGLWILALAFVAGSAAQVARGRADIRRGHRILSVVAWSILAPAVAAYAAWGAWAVRPSPRDLKAVTSVQAAPAGSWMAVAGRLRWPRPQSMMPTLLVDARTDRFVRVAETWDTHGPLFSSDGSQAAWITNVWSGEPRLFVADLRAEAPVARSAPLPVPPGRIVGFALSPDGRDVAVVQVGQTSVFAIGSQKPLAVAPVHVDAYAREVVFATDGHVRTLAGPQDWLAPGVLSLVTIDPATGGYRVSAEIPTRGNPMAEWGPGAERLAIIDHQERRPSLALHDGATGARVATLAEEGTADRLSCTFLHDGRLAVVEERHGVRLRIFRPDGAETSSIEVAPSLAFARAVEVAPGVIAVDLQHFESFDVRATVLVDADAGRIVRIERGLSAAPSRPFAGDPSAATTPANLFVDATGALVKLDLATGERRRLLPRD
jgi:hypothetical protein